LLLLILIFALIALELSDLQIWCDNYCINDSVYNVFRLDKTSTALIISHPLETSNVPGSINNEQLHMSPTDRTGAERLPRVTLPTATQQHRTREPVSLPLANDPEQQLSKSSPQHCQLQQFSSSHASPTYALQQPVSSPQNDVNRTSQALRGISPKQVIPGPTNRPSKPVSLPLANDQQHLPENSPHYRQLPQYPQQLSDSHAGPTYTPQQPVPGPQNDVGQTSQALRGISPKQVISGLTNRPNEPVSLPLADNPKHQLSQNLPQHRQLPQYPQQLSDSHATPTNVSASQLPASSPLSDVSRTSQAVREASPKQMISGTDAPSHSRPTLHTAPVTSSTFPVEQNVYDRPSVNQQYTPVYHYLPYGQPAGNYDRYRHHDAAFVSHGLDPYRQRVPLGYRVSQSKLGLPTSDVDRVHPQIATDRSNSCREQPPAANYDVIHKKKSTVQTNRGSPQRDVSANKNGRSHSGERVLSFGNGRSPHRQNDPYRLHYPAVAGSNQVHHNVAGSGLPLSRENNVNNRQTIYGAENANDYTAVRVGGVPSERGLSPAVSRSTQYSVPAYHYQQNSEVIRYPSPSRVVEHSAGLQPVTRNEQHRSDLRNPLIESQYLRGRQVCKLYSVLCFYLHNNDVVAEN